MERKKITDPALAKSMIRKHLHWYHRIEVAPGVMTPGIHDSQMGLRHLDALGLPVDCSGLRALDIGCRDGFFAFELEHRGAHVIGLDYADPDETGFSIASQLVGSEVTYIVDNVYNLDPEKHGTFDLVLFLGVLYHLRNPMLALDRIRSITGCDGLLFVETQLPIDRGIRHTNTPAMQFFPRSELHGDPTSKWAPNLPGLRAVVEESQFEVLQAAAHRKRGYLRARAIEDAELDMSRELDGATGMFRHGPFYGDRRT